MGGTLFLYPTEDFRRACCECQQVLELSCCVTWLHTQEKSLVLGELALKARMTTETLNTVDGVRCNEVMGAMYAFPRVFLPDKAIAEAKVSAALFFICLLFALFSAQ